MIYRQAGRETWQARIWNRHAGKYRSVSTGTTDHAKALQVEALLRQAAGGMRRDIIARALDDLTGQGAAAGPTLAGMWRDNPGAGREHTARALSDWRAFVAWAGALGVTEAASAGRELARQYLATLAGLSRKSVANIRGNLRATWERAGIGGENPFAGRSLPIAGHDGERGRAFTGAELAALLEAATGEQRGIILAGLYTGLRYGDLLRLRWRDIRGGVLRLEPSKTRRHGVVVEIPVHRRLAAWLAANGNGAELVFPTLALADRSSTDRGWFGKLMRRAGIAAHADGEKASFHSLRHTFNSRLSAAGVPQETIMRLAGHLNAATSSRYTHDTESLRRAVDGLE